MNDFEKYVHKKWPEYRALVTDQAVTAAILCKSGKITHQERDDTFDTLLISHKDRESLVTLIDR